MNNDPVRRKIHELLWERGLTMRQVSLAIGRNVSYMHGFLERGSPKVLSHVDSERLAEVLECDVAALRHVERPPRSKPKAKKQLVPPVTKQSPVPLASISEVEIEVSAGPGTLAQEFVEEKARWFLPEGMIRYEGDAVPGAVCALRVRGDSMEPELSEGDRLLVDTSRRVPSTGEMFVLWDGGGLVVKRVEPVHDTGGPSQLRLKSANPDYADYTSLAEEAHIVGKVLWTVRKV